MAAIKVYLDEDVHTYIAQALRLRGWEALTTEEAGQRGADDPEQILFATQRGYSILTYNINDYPRLHYEIVTSGETHAGIIVGTREDPRRNIVLPTHLCRAPFMLRLHPTGDAQHERVQKPLVLSVAQRSRRADTNMYDTSHLGSL